MADDFQTFIIKNRFAVRQNTKWQSKDNKSEIHTAQKRQLKRSKRHVIYKYLQNCSAVCAFVKKHDN